MASPHPQSTLTPAVVEAIETAVRVNPSWRAAADYAGVSENTLDGWKQRANAYERRLANPEELADLRHRRIYAAARDAWTAGNWGLAMKRLRRLDEELDRDTDLPFYEIVQRWRAARAKGEIELVAVIRRCAQDGDWRAAQALLRMGWPKRYSERIEVAADLTVEAELLDVEARIAAGLDELKRKRGATGRGGRSRWGTAGPVGKSPRRGRPPLTPSTPSSTRSRPRCRAAVIAAAG